jgi:NTE family protein
MSGEQNLMDLVFEGGGVKGIGLGGAYAALEDRGLKPNNVAGTSAGAITAALVAAGYSAPELKDIVFHMPFTKFKDVGGISRVPFFGGPLNVLKDLGIYEGKFFHEWISGLLAKKNVKVFGDLVNEDISDPKYRHKLRVIASDVTHRRMLILPDDAPHLGIEPDEMLVADAVRMSMSIPIFFEPVEIRGGDEAEHEHTIVDGGMLSNFPVWLFDCPPGQTPRWPTFGLMLVEPEPRTAIGHRLAHEDDAEIEHGSLIDFAKGLALTMMAAHDRMYLDEATFARTIAIPTLGVGTTEFEITPDRVEALYQSGHDAAVKFLDGFDFQKYIATYREAEPPGRQDQIQGTATPQPAPGTP